MAVDNTESYFLKEIESASCSQMRKCWLMTAVSILPSSFPIRLQAFRGAELDNDADEAARQLLFMYTNYAKEARLFNILCKCIAEVQQTARDGFYAGVFRKLPTEKQCSILLKYAEMQTDELDRCKTILFVLSNYDHHAHNVAIDFIEQLLSNEKQYYETDVLNEYARMLVCDVLPVVLRSASVPLFTDGKKLQKLFVRSVQFCVCSATRHLLHDEDPISTPNRHAHGDSPTHSWQLLGSLVSGFLRHFQCETLANALNNVARGSSSSSSVSSGEQQAADDALAEWTSLRSSVRKALSAADSKSHSQVVRGAVCWTVALLLRCAAAYVRDSLRAHVHAATPSNGISVTSTKRSDSVDLRSPTKRGVGPNTSTIADDAQPRVGVLLPSSVTDDFGDDADGSQKRARLNALVGHFRVAIACWSFLLATDATHKEFQKVFAHLLARGEWFWFKLFEIDMCMLHADWRDACETIVTTRQLLANVRAAGTRLRSHFAAQLAARFELQQAACAKQLGDTVAAARHALRTLVELEAAPSGGDASRMPIAHFHADESTASLGGASQSSSYFVAVCTRESATPIAIRFVVDALRPAIREPPSSNENTSLPSRAAVQRQLDLTAHLVVLTQSGWPRLAHGANETLRTLEAWLHTAPRDALDGSDESNALCCSLFLNRISRVELLEIIMRVVTQCDNFHVRFNVQSCCSTGVLQRLTSADTRKQLIEHVRDHLAQARSSPSSLYEFLLELNTRFDLLFSA